MRMKEKRKREEVGSEEDEKVRVEWKKRDEIVDEGERKSDRE